MGRQAHLDVNSLLEALQRSRKSPIDAVSGPASKPGRSRSEVARVYALLLRYRSIDYARREARQLAGAALFEALAAFRGIPGSEEKRFILEMILYVVERDR